MSEKERDRRVSECLDAARERENYSAKLLAQSRELRPRFYERSRNLRRNSDWQAVHRDYLIQQAMWADPNQQAPAWQTTNIKIPPEWWTIERQKMKSRL